MARSVIRLTLHCVTYAAAFTFSVHTVSAQSILRDAETEALLRDMSAPLIKASGLEPRNVDFVLINDPSLNAFVAGGQAVYIHSGLINAADSANEVQGVIAHELGHITAGHVINTEGGKAATNISLLSLFLGAAAAAVGGAEAAMGVLMAGQQAAMGKYLAFNRAQEAAADAAGASYLSQAGITGKGSINFFEKLAALEYRAGYRPSEGGEFARTHPVTTDRISNLLGVYEKDAAWNTPSDPTTEQKFARVKAKLFGYLATPRDTLKVYPDYMTGVPARYARAYAYHKDSQIDKALNEVNALLETNPIDPYFLELKGQILLESGRPAAALESLRLATEYSRNEPLIATVFGHALISTEKPENYAEAERILRTAVGRDRDNPFAWHQLGVVYAANGDIPRARLASAEQQVLARQWSAALRNAEAAEAALPKDSIDWLRAQDITMLARNALPNKNKRKDKDSDKNDENRPTPQPIPDTLHHRHF